MKCDGCGADLGERVTQCDYCGRRVGILDSFDVEATTLLRTLEDRLVKEIARRTDPVLYPAYFAWIISGPIAYVALGHLTDIGIIARAASALLLMVPGFLLLGWLILNREESAEDAIWSESAAAELRGFMLRKALSPSELLVLVKRVLGDEARLVKRLARGDRGIPKS